MESSSVKRQGRMRDFFREVRHAYIRIRRVKRGGEIKAMKEKVGQMESDFREWSVRTLERRDASREGGKNIWIQRHSRFLQCITT